MPGILAYDVDYALAGQEFAISAELTYFQIISLTHAIGNLKRAFDAVEDGAASFSELCNQGQGIVTFGDEGAYFWKPPGNNKK